MGNLLYLSLPATFIWEKKKPKHFEKQYGAFAFYSLVNENDLH